VRVVDEDRRAVVFADRSSRPFAPSRCSSVASTAAGSLPVPIASPAATSAFSIWNSPTSGS